MKLLPDVRKIAVLRANGIGDLMFVLPALDALREAYPHAQITLLGCDWHRSFLEGRPGPVDRVVAVPASRGVRVDTGRAEDPRELDAFFDRMHAERFDLAVQLHGGGRYSNPFVLRLGARTTIGLRSPDAAALDAWVPYVYFQPEIVRYLEVVALAGARQHRLDPRLVVTDRDLDDSLEAVPAVADPFVVLHPSATDTRRRWPPAKFGSLGAQLRATGLAVYVIGIDRDRTLVEAVVNAMGGGSRENLCGRLSLSGLAGLLSRAALVVSNDSGPLHLASAVGTPTVGVYWCGNVITAAPVTRSRHRLAISWRLDCARCGASSILAPCGHTDSFVADIDVEEVRREALDVLTQAGTRDGRSGRAESRIENGEGVYRFAE